MIVIDYLEQHQLCRISTDTIDNNWKQIRFQYNDISDQSEVYEDAVELPWHSFISNVQLLSLVVNLYNIPISFTTVAQKLWEQSVRDRAAIDAVGENQYDSEEIEEKLRAFGFARELKKYQANNIAVLARLPAGATFSVPGAGKTTEAIAFWLIHRKPDQGLIVICPKNAFPAWEEQFFDCLKENAPVVRRLTQGVDKIETDLRVNPTGVFIISYQQFIRAADPIAAHLHHHNTFVFLDESHRMKGGNKTDTGRHIQYIAHLPIGKLIMSGTPMPNSVADLVPQYSFLFPTDGDVNETTVVDKIQKIYVRTTKKQLELDPVDPRLIQIPMSEPQKNLYDLIRSEEFRQLSGLGRNDRKFYRQLGKSYIRLLQVVSNPRLLMKNSYEFPDALREAVEYGDSNKIRYLETRARQLAKEGKKVLIWSGFVENIESITQMLSDLGAKCIHGGVEAGSDEEENTRERIVKDFHNDSDMFVLVANPAACSEGISLHTICHHAIYLDRNYNAAQFLQSMDRIHRLGLLPGTQTTIEILHTPDSIDELIHSRLQDKVRRMADVLNDASLHIEPLTVELDDEGFDEEDARLLLKHLKG